MRFIKYCSAPPHNYNYLYIYAPRHLATVEAGEPPVTPQFFCLLLSPIKKSPQNCW